LEYQVKASDLEGALTAAADALEMDLDMLPDEPHIVYGEAVKQLNWFGTDLKVMPTIIQSKVEVSRGLVMLVAHLMGNLYCCLLADSPEGKLTLFLLDGPKIGFTPTEAHLFPKNWLREKLYATMLPALKATYTKKFYAQQWKLVEKGKFWMETYIAEKAEARKEQNTKSFAR
jgi:hypothetical protein